MTRDSGHSFQQPITEHSVVRVLVVALIMLANAPRLTAGKFNAVLKTGDPAPAWTGLLGVDGKRHSLGDLKDAPAVLLVFLSNRCPMTRAYEARLKRLASEYRKRGLKVVGVSIGHAPTDRLDKMIARSAMSKYNFPYCIDLTQRLGRRYGATCTPHAFLLDARRRVAYMGAIDDNVEPARIEFHYLRDAIRAVLAGKRPEVVETLQKGCEIKYVSR